jgi:hypothetical protein
VVNDNNLIVERGAEFGVQVPIDSKIGPHVVALADFHPPRLERRPVQRHSAAHDGHESATWL